MKNLFTPIILLCLFTVQSFAGNITGKVLDNNNEPVVYANVLLYNSSDSSFVKAEFSYDDGSFSIPLNTHPLILHHAKFLSAIRRMLEKD